MLRFSWPHHLCSAPKPGSFFFLFSAEQSELLHTTTTTTTIAVTLSMPNIFPHPFFYSNNFVYEYGHAIFFHNFYFFFTPFFFHRFFFSLLFFCCRFSYFAKSSFYAGTNVFCIYIFAVEGRERADMRCDGMRERRWVQESKWRVADGIGECRVFLEEKGWRGGEIQPETILHYTQQPDPTKTEPNRAVLVSLIKIYEINSTKIIYMKP